MTKLVELVELDRATPDNHTNKDLYVSSLQMIRDEDDSDGCYSDNDDSDDGGW